MNSLTALLGEGQIESLVIWGLPAIVGLMMALVAVVAGDDSGERRRRRIKRVQSHSRRTSTSISPEQIVSIRRRTSDSSIPILDLLIKRVLPRPEVLRNRLEATGSKITLGTYLAICIGIFAVVTLAGVIVAVIPNLAAPLLGLFAGLGLPHMVVGFLGTRRKAKFINHFPEAIDLMVRGLKSGLPVNESLKVAGEEIADPVGFELRHITDQVRIGTKVEKALDDAGKRLDIQEFNFMNIAMSIQAETGGNLAETLGNLSDVLRKRRQLKLKIRALSSEAKASAYIIGSLPFIMTGIIHMTNENYLMLLYTDPRGNMAVFAGLVWFAIGAFVMWKMVRFES